MQERRIFPSDIRKHNIRTLILTAVLIAVLLVITGVAIASILLKNLDL